MLSPVPFSLRATKNGIFFANYALFANEPDQEDVPPTNNRTEQSIRFVVIERKVTQGTQSDAGMRFCERMWTIVAICKKMGKSVFEFLKSAVAANFTDTPYPQLIS